MAAILSVLGDLFSAIAFAMMGKNQKEQDEKTSK
jgi:hypothetical protein